MIEDEKIIEMFFERSEQGIRELDIKYGTVCHKLSYHIVGSRQNAEECVNDAYLGVWNTIPPARPNPLLSYVLKIVRNISIKIYWRKEAAKRSSHYTIALEEIETYIQGLACALHRVLRSFLSPVTGLHLSPPSVHYNLRHGSSNFRVKWLQSSEYSD